MFNEEIQEVSNSAYKKVSLLNNNFLGYFLASMLAGVFVAIAVCFAFYIGAAIHNYDGYKLILGLCFGVALSLVAFCGAELFTGNVFVMTVGVFRKKISISNVLKLWVVCYLGNLIGSLLIVFFFYLGGYLNPGAVPEYFISAAHAKIDLQPIQILIRAIMCNILVCCATWCGYRCKSESGKLIMISWCILAFITTGFEHSIANMSLLTIGLISPGSDIVITDLLYNISLATIGNILGGSLFLAIPYLIIAREKNKQKG